MCRPTPRVEGHLHARCQNNILGGIHIVKTNHSIAQSHESATAGQSQSRGAGIDHKGGDDRLALTPAPVGWSVPSPRGILPWFHWYTRAFVRSSNNSFPLDWFGPGARREGSNRPHPQWAKAVSHPGTSGRNFFFVPQPYEAGWGRPMD